MKTELTTNGEKSNINTMKTTANSTSIQAVIFMGASSVSMMIAEERGEDLRVLDVLSQPLALAEDIFRNGSISRETLDRCVQIVLGFNNLLQEYRQCLFL